MLQGLAVQYQYEIEREIYFNFNPSNDLDETGCGERCENYVWPSADGLAIKMGMRFSEPSNHQSPLFHAAPVHRSPQNKVFKHSEVGCSQPGDEVPALDSL